MKLYTNKLVSTVLASTLSLSLITSPVLASDFSDINEIPWATSFILDAVDLGLVTGYTDGTFKPSQQMTVGEFFVMLCNSYDALLELSDNDGADSYVDGQWYSKFVYAVHKSNLFPVGMNATTEDMTKAITREQAAHFVYRAMTTLGGEYKTVQAQPFDTSNIKDYTSINEGQREAVVEMYLKGIMSGYSNGEFGPKNELTRAELCVIMLALHDTDRRTPYVAPEAPPLTNADYPDAVFNENGQQIITQGTVSMRPQAVEGDIVIDANGNEIILVVGPSGVLGEGQGVAPDLGLIWPWGTQVRDGNVNTPLDPSYDSLGNEIGGAYFWVNQITGEGHWASEWSTMATYPGSDVKGTFEGELSSDKNWYWGTTTWQSAYSQTFTSQGLAGLLEVNGLK